MDFIKNLAGGNQQGHGQTAGGAPQGQQSSGGGGGFMDKLNGLAGEELRVRLKKIRSTRARTFVAGMVLTETTLPAAVDFIQERMGGGAQNNESATEQFKDEQISDMIRQQYKNKTGKEFPVADKS